MVRHAGTRTRNYSLIFLETRSLELMIFQCRISFNHVLHMQELTMNDSITSPEVPGLFQLLRLMVYHIAMRLFSESNLNSEMLVSGEALQLILIQQTAFSLQIG